MPYGNYIATNVPTVLQGPNAKPKVQSYGELQDQITDIIREAIRARWPEYAPPDALPYLETERGIDRAFGDTDTTFATRLKEAWDVWPFAGSARGVLKALKDQGYNPTEMYLFQQNGLYWQINTLDDEVTPTAIADPFSYWIEDPSRDIDFWSPFSILFSAPPALWNNSATVPFTSAPVVNSVDVTWDFPFENTSYDIAFSVLTTDGSAPVISISSKTKFGCTVNGGPFDGEVYLLAWRPANHPLVDPSASELNKLCRLVKRWKAGRSIFDGFTVLLQGQLWGFPIADWGDPGLVWGSSEGARVEC